MTGACCSGQGSDTSVIHEHVRSLDPAVSLSVRLKALHDMSKYLSTVEGEDGGQAHKLCKESGAVPLMMELLKECGLEDSVLLQCVLSCFVNLTYIGGPELIKQHDEAFELLVKMLQSSDASTQFYAVAGVFNMSKDAECVEKICTPETDAALKKMVQSENKSIGRYAGKTLTNIAHFPMKDCGRLHHKNVLATILLAGGVANYAISGTTFLSADTPAWGLVWWQLIPVVLMWAAWLSCVLALGLKEAHLPTGGCLGSLLGRLSQWAGRRFGSTQPGLTLHAHRVPARRWSCPLLSRFGRRRAPQLPLAMSMDDLNTLSSCQPQRHSSCAQMVSCASSHCSTPPPVRKSVSEPAHHPPPATPTSPVVQIEGVIPYELRSVEVC